MGYNLFLDNNITPKDVCNANDKDLHRYCTYKWNVVGNYNDFKYILETKGVPDIISFEHDLYSEHKNYKYENIDYDCFVEKTGYHAAEYLIEYCSLYNKNLPIVLIHTQNEIGHKNIKNLFI